MKLSAMPDDHLAARRADKSQGGLVADWRRWSRAERLAVIVAGLITLGLAVVIAFVV
jgi:hypothetical protein